jgi:class 3 adenylate cyclase/KaiC/GvpD/RAD55 family RecA-like ATPase
VGDGSRQVATRSVLFTDVVGSTQMRIRLGEDAADEVRRTHDKMLTEAVEAQGGIVVKGTGDGIHAAFESAADAVRGAVAVQQAVEAFCRRNPDRSFAVRVGLSVGDVAAEGGDLYGVPVVEASRLCGTAAGGEILAADLIRALARGRVSNTFEPMGDFVLKGLQDPVAACRVIWEPAWDVSPGATDHPVALPAALASSQTPYIGREELRHRLRAEWDAARDGDCRTVLLVGEPGVGKTRTAAELARQAFADGGLVLYGRCDEDLDVPYQAFVEALDHYARHARIPVLGRLSGELSRLVPDLRTHVGQLPNAVSSDPASEEYRLFEATASWLVEAARAAGGLVLVLDDLHWATKPTLHLMQHVVRAAADESAPVLFVATYRDTELGRTDSLASALADLRRVAGVDRLQIDNLTIDEVLALVEAAAGHDLDEPIQVLATVMYAETEGNPFFVGEVLRHLIETGAVGRDGDRWVVAEPDRVTIPEGVRDVIGRRLSRLPAAANDVLSMAAVLGRDFDVELLLAVSDTTEPEALDALDQSVRARLLEETGVDEYRFAHALVRTTLYDALSATRRRRLHRRVADVLETIRPDDVRALAHHCTEAGPDGGDNSRALRYTLAAAEQSLAARAFGDAEAAFRAALDRLDDPVHHEAPERAVALCGLGEAQRDQSVPEFRETLLEASRLAARDGNVALLQRAVLANSRGYVSVVGGVDPERVALLETTLERIGPKRSPSRARLLGQLAQELVFTDDPRRTTAIADEAIAIARELGDPELLGGVLVMTSYTYNQGPDYEDRLARTAEMLELADACGDPTLRVMARIRRSSACLTVGDFVGAAAITHEAVAIAESDGTPLIQWTARANCTREPAFAGRLDEAERLNAEMVERAGELGQSDGPEWGASVAVGLMWLRGVAGVLADGARDFADRYPFNTGWRTAYVWLLCEAGRYDEARAVLAEHDVDPTALLAEAWPFTATMQVALTSWHIGDEALGRKAIAALTPYRHCWCHYLLFIMAPVSWGLGAAHAAVGEYDAAVEFMTETLQRAQAKGGRAHAAVFGVDLAKVLLQRNAHGDRDRAAEVLADARAIAADVGAAGVIARIDAISG